MATFWVVATSITCFKLLLLKSYKSTDFEVHRNWLAITHSLPISKWYHENTSEWTLDYPPLFAWMEHGLSHVGRLFDPQMLVVANLNYSSQETVLFQRLSVIVTDFVLMYAVYAFISKCFKPDRNSKHESLFESSKIVFSVLLLGNFGLLIVDHIHFQYNGFLMGILLLSIVRLFEGRNISAAFWFAVLLNLKHIYLYIAPAFFVYLLRCHCFMRSSGGQSKWQLFSIRRLIVLGSTVACVFLVSFGPFITMGQTGQVLTRLFPFQRGLCHAYWAPNFWALYNMADKIATIAAVKMQMLENSSVIGGAMTGGLVQEYQHTVLPSVLPLATVILTVVGMMPSLAKLWCSPYNMKQFVRCLTICAFTSFQFGWHVHEKAILLITIPLTILAIIGSKKEAGIFLILSSIGGYSLFPLLFTHFEAPIKVLLLALYCLYAFTSLQFIHSASSSLTSLPLLNNLESVYLLGIVPLEVCNKVVLPYLGISKRYPFLPLMSISVYCAVGTFYCWLRFYYITLTEKEQKKKIN